MARPRYHRRALDATPAKSACLCGPAAPAQDQQLSAEARYSLGMLQAQVIQDRHDQMARAERTRWFSRVVLRELLHWFS